MKWVPIAVACLMHHSLPKPFRIRLQALIGPYVSSGSAWIGKVVFPFFLAAVPPQSPASLLALLQSAACRWPNLVPKHLLALLPDWLVGRAGPFGHGCGKGCELICAWLLLVVWEKELWPSALHFGPIPGVWTLLAVLVLAAVVNLVLTAWSIHGRGHRGDHKSVHAMVESSMGRSLTITEHCGLAALAIGNAVFEEGVSRGFFMYEFRVRGQLSSHAANFWQAVAFGLWHYHGIPSGLMGVCLTFIYGGLMGLLHMYGGGMLLPILAHSLADYFIFSVIARR